MPIEKVAVPVPGNRERNIEELVDDMTALIELLDYTPAGAASFMPISALVSGKRRIVSRENRPRCYFSLYLVNPFRSRTARRKTFDLPFPIDAPARMHSFNRVH